MWYYLIFIIHILFLRENLTPVGFHNSFSFGIFSKEKNSSYNQKEMHVHKVIKERGFVLFLRKDIHQDKNQQKWRERGTCRGYWERVKKSTTVTRQRWCCSYFSCKFMIDVNSRKGAGRVAIPGLQGQHCLWESQAEVPAQRRCRGAHGLLQFPHAFWTSLSESLTYISCQNKQKRHVPLF